MVSGSGWAVACGLLGFLGWVVFAVACGSGASFIAVGGGFVLRGLNCWLVWFG